MKAITLIKLLAAQVEKHGNIEVDVADESGFPFPAVGICQRLDDDGSKVIAINIVNEYNATCDYVIKPGDM